MATAPQSYANHTHRPRAWAAAVLLALIALFLLLYGAFRAPSLQTVALTLLGIAALLTLGVMRMFVTRLQDRIIRAEMHVRLNSLGHGADLRRLTMRQLVALRFASDAELSALVHRTLAESLTADAIKRAVTDWQPDLRRV